MEADVTVKIATALVSAALGVGVLFGYVATVNTSSVDAWHPHAGTTYDQPDKLVIIRLNP